MINFGVTTVGDILVKDMIIAFLAAVLIYCVPKAKEKWRAQKRAKSWIAIEGSERENGTHKTASASETCPERVSKDK